MSTESSENVEHWTDSDFEKNLAASSLPVVVDFWATWCGPCTVMAPIFIEAAGLHKDKYKFVKVDVDDNPESSEKYSILSIPTMIIFDKGKVMKQHSGVITKAELEKLLG